LKETAQTGYQTTAQDQSEMPQHFSLPSGEAGH
jgi:hypothetical protein